MCSRALSVANNLMDKVGPLTNSRWIRPVLMALSLLTAFLGVTGCSPQHPH